MSEVAEATEKVHQVHFRVDGKWLADFARTRVDEGRWDAALNLLVDSLHGLTHDQALAILKGESDLTGDSGHAKGIRLKKLKKDGPLAKARAERMEYMYGDLFRLGDKIWRPYAVVSGWCRDDWHFAITFKGPWNLHNVRDDKYHGAFRSLYYANNAHRDMLVRIPERMVGDRVIADVLCEEFTGTVPFWVKLPTNIDIEKFVEHVFNKKGIGWRGLEIRGAFERGYIADAITSQERDEEPGTAEAIEGVEEAVQNLPPAASQDTEPEQKMVENEGKRDMYAVIDLVEQYMAENSDDYRDVRSVSNKFESIINRLSRHLDDAGWERVEKARAWLEAKTEELLRAKIVAQADEHGGWLEIPLKTKSGLPYPKMPVMRVPRNPFLIWTFRANFNFEEHGIDLKWDYVAGSGWKMYNDDPAHTDWMIGAGIPLKDTYDHDEDSLGQRVRSCAYEYKDVLVKQYTNRQFTVLARDKDRKWVSGTICHPKPGERVAPGSIAVVPNAGPDYQFAMETANMEGLEGRERGCIICETGGKLAHLAIVGREYKCVVLMIPDALKLYKPMQRVWIDLEAGTIEHRVW